MTDQTPQNRTVTLGNDIYNIRYPISFQEAAWLMIIQRGGANRIKDTSATPQQEFLLGLEPLNQLQETLVKSIFLHKDTGKTLTEGDLYDPAKVPPEQMTAIITDTLPYLPDVTEILTLHKTFRESARVNPPQDATQGLVPMLEGAVPESVKIGNDYHLLRPFSFGMQSIAQRLLSRGRLISRGLGREGEVNPAVLLLDGLLNGANDAAPFVRALLPKRHDHMLDVGEVFDLPGLDVLKAIYTAIASSSMQAFLQKQSWNLEENTTPTLPPRKNLN